MAKENPKIRWKIIVKRKKDQEEIDAFVVIARKKNWAARTGVILSADHHNMGTSELVADATKWDNAVDGNVTQEKYEYLVAAETEPESS